MKNIVITIFETEVAAEFLGKLDRLSFKMNEGAGDERNPMNTLRPLILGAMTGDPRRLRKAYQAVRKSSFNHYEFGRTSGGVRQVRVYEFAGLLKAMTEVIHDICMKETAVLDYVIEEEEDSFAPPQ